MSCLNYKGYVGSVEFSEIDEVFHGKVLGIRSLISFEGDSVKSLVKDFHESVDEYLEFCADNNIKPEQPFKGSFNIRIGSELHRQAALFALARGLSLNTLVTNAIRKSIMSSPREQAWETFLEGLNGFSDDFMKDGRELQEYQERESFD